MPITTIAQLRALRLVQIEHLDDLWHLLHEYLIVVVQRVVVELFELASAHFAAPLLLSNGILFDLRSSV